MNIIYDADTYTVQDIAARVTPTHAIYELDAYNGNPVDELLYVVVDRKTDTIVPGTNGVNMHTAREHI